MEIDSRLSDAAIQAELGQRIARHRLERNMSQKKLSAEAGVSTRTMERIEAGDSSNTGSLLRVLRALDLVDRIEDLVPPPAPSPIDRLRTEGRRRKRASG